MHFPMPLTVGPAGPRQVPRGNEQYKINDVTSHVAVKMIPIEATISELFPKTVKATLSTMDCSAPRGIFRIVTFFLILRARN